MQALSSIFLVLAQTGPTPTSAVAPANSLWDLAIKGGPVMIPIGLASILALSIVIERLILLRARRVVPPGFLEGLEAVADDPERARDYCKVSPAPIARVIAAGVKRHDRSTEVIEKSLEEAGQREVTRFRQRVRVLSALPQSSTMLGLLGTILGMIRTFTAVSASAEALGKAEMLAKGIYEAWTCTAAGLLVAIPTLVMYHVVLARIDARAADLDRAAGEWLEQRSAAGRPARAPEARPAPPQPVVSVVHAPGPEAPAGALAAT